MDEIGLVNEVNVRCEMEDEKTDEDLPTVILDLTGRMSWRDMEIANMELERRGKRTRYLVGITTASFTRQAEDPPSAL